MRHIRTRQESLLRLALTRRGRRWLVALVAAVVPLAVATVPAHAELESVYALPWAICNAGTCAAETTVHLLLPADYAACVAALTAAQELPNTPPNVDGAPPGSVAVDACDSSTSDVDASLTTWAQWTPGGCVGGAETQAIVIGRYPVWAAPAGGSTGGTTCSTVDSGYTQTFTMDSCPGTTFQVTADVKGFANGTYQGSYSVNGSGTCATIFDVLVVEGAAVKGLGSLIGCKVFCPGPPVLDTSVAATGPARMATTGVPARPSASVPAGRPFTGGVTTTTCRRSLACPA